jgi:hypothetical protein
MKELWQVRFFSNLSLFHHNNDTNNLSNSLTCPPRIIQASATRKAWNRRTGYGLSHPDPHHAYSYLLNDIERIASPTYRPGASHIFHAYHGEARDVREGRFIMDGINLCLYDIPSQLTSIQPKRTITFTTNSEDAVVFVAGLSDYEDRIMDGKRVNRLEECLAMYRSICHDPAFEKSLIFLILNKYDQFSEKIQRCDIRAQTPFRDYEGPERDFDGGARYFIGKFRECRGERDDGVMDFDSTVHLICATDLNNRKYYAVGVLVSM